MQPFECKGLWSLPHSDAAPVAGILRVAANGDLRLALIGALGSITGSVGTKKHPIILGSVDESPFGNSVTLTGAYQTSLKRGSFEDVREEYHPRMAFFGARFQEGSEFAFRGLQLRLGGLSEWAHPLSGFDQPPFTPHGIDETVSLLKHTMKAGIGGAIPGGELSLGMSLRASASIFQGFSFREHAELNISFERPHSAEELNGRFVYPFQNLMTFVADRAQGLEQFCVWRHERISSEGNPEIQVVGPRVQPDDEEEPKSVRRYEMLFTLEDIEGDIAQFANKWLRLTETYSHACNIFFGLYYGPPAYVDLTFLSIMQCLCLYQARREDGAASRAEEERKLKGILAELNEQQGQWLLGHIGSQPYPPVRDVLSVLVREHSAAMQPLVSGRPAEFVSRVIETLHYVIRRDTDFNININSGADFFWLTQRLRFLLKACFLHELGFRSEKVRTLFERNAMYQHVSQITAAKADKS